MEKSRRPRQLVAIDFYREVAMAPHRPAARAGPRGVYPPSPAAASWRAPGFLPKQRVLARPDTEIRRRLFGTHKHTPISRLVCGLLAGASLLILSNGVADVVRIAAMYRWPSVPGEVLSLSVEQGAQAATWEPRVRYAFHVDGKTIGRKEQLLNHMATAMRFPKEFGHNWDALEDHLTDLEWVDADGYVIYYDHIDPLLGAHPDQFETLGAATIPYGVGNSARHWTQMFG